MADRRLLMIPGPIELEPDVLQTLGERTRSHMDAGFAECFGRALERMRQVFQAGKDAQPFVLAGSGTLAMDTAIANVVEPGAAAVVVDTGYFSARMADVLERWGARVTRVGAPLGDAPSLDALQAALKRERPAVVTITHVDTSTGVRADVEAMAKLAREHGALVVVDGVCSLGGEVFRQEAWGVDVALTASQKAMGAPAGLALLVASPRAIEASRARKGKLASIYLDWSEWLPIMRAYEARKPQYFATPAVNLVAALDTSLAQLVAEGMEARFVRHARNAGAFRAAWRALELRPLPVREALAANTLSAVYYPQGIDAALVASVAAEGVVVAGGLHPEAKTKYFRVGHMGACTASDVLATVGAIERAFAKAGYARPAVAAAAEALRTFTA
ncbi:MAG TPA: alanine--glyoxylate aminotransferase family protein [Polyangiaceae bacterium]|jgi:alanine-glyoxylate transaminase/serine-glyoxylate transaminase/serine-pyruvate transaminase